MWLLNTSTLLLKHFSDDRQAVLEGYAILSHTWGEDEVSFHDMTRSSLLDDHKRRKAKKKAGFMKVEKACDQAKRDGHAWVWIDTCCIDKSSSAELTEAINSMYRWYADAIVCYAYLADVAIEEDRRLEMVNGPDDIDYLRHKFKASRWFTRGWTLQELIAPVHVLFFDAQWFVITTKIRSAAVLAEVTGIDERVFRQRSYINIFSVATRMSWAARRETTRVEDEAYSLLGIFDIKVNMPMIYGEGQKAFVRLQEEIMKRSTDQSILAWSAIGRGATRFEKTLLAPTARCFANAGSIDMGDDAAASSYEMSNSGLRISLPTSKHGGHLLAELNCQIGGNSVALQLRARDPRHGHVGDESALRIICEVERRIDGTTYRTLERPPSSVTTSDLLILRDAPSTFDVVRLGRRAAQKSLSSPKNSRQESPNGGDNQGFVIV